MQLLCHADLHRPALRNPNAYRGKNRLAIDDGVLASAFRRQCRHQALPRGLLSDVRSIPVSAFRSGHVGTGVLLRLACRSSNVPKRWNVDAVWCVASIHQL